MPYPSDHAALSSTKTVVDYPGSNDTFEQAADKLNLAVDTLNALQVNAYHAFKTQMNVLDMDGVVGDGATDDSAAIAAGIGTSTAPKVIYFPPGTYCMKNIALPSNTTVLARGASFVMPEGSGGTDYFWKNTSAASDLLIEGGFYNGASNSGGLYWNAVSGGAVLGGVWTYCTVGIGLSSCDNVHIERNRLANITANQNGAIGVWDSNSDILVTGNRIEGVASDCILVYSSDLALASQYVIVTDNHCEAFNTGEIDGRAGIHLYRVKKAVVSSNKVAGGTNAEGIRCRNSEMFTIADNYIETCDGPGIECDDLTSENVGNGSITGNTIVGCAGYGIGYWYSAECCKPVTITGNRVVDTAAGFGVEGSGIAVKAPECVISGNNITGSAAYGISAAGTNTVITGNYSDDPFMLWGIGSAVVEGNNFPGGVTFTGTRITQQTE